MESDFELSCKDQIQLFKMLFGEIETKHLAFTIISQYQRPKIMLNFIAPTKVKLGYIDKLQGYSFNHWVRCLAWEELNIIKHQNDTWFDENKNLLSRLCYY